MSQHSFVGCTLHLEGQTSTASYELERPLGSGGYSSVYLGRGTSPHSPPYAALKIARPPKDEHPPLHDLATEFRMAQRCASSNVAGVFDTGTAHIKDPEGEQHIREAMACEYIPGLTLRQQLETGRFAVETALEITGQVAEGLELIHRRGLVHGDVKPDNIIYNPELQQRTVIMDFGAARPIGEPSPQVVYGTPGYIAPEQFDDKAATVTPDIDAFSFAAVVFELLQGAKAFPGDTKESYRRSNRSPHRLPSLAIASPVVREAISQELWCATHPSAKSRPGPATLTNRLYIAVEEANRISPNRVKKLGGPASAVRTLIASTLQLQT